MSIEPHAHLAKVSCGSGHGIVIREWAPTDFCLSGRETSTHIPFICRKNPPAHLEFLQRKVSSRIPNINDPFEGLRSTHFQQVFPTLDLCGTLRNALLVKC